MKTLLRALVISAMMLYCKAELVIPVTTTVLTEVNLCGLKENVEVILKENSSEINMKSIKSIIDFKKGTMTNRINGKEYAGTLVKPGLEPGIVEETGETAIIGGFKTKVFKSTGTQGEIKLWVATDEKGIREKLEKTMIVSGLEMRTYNIEGLIVKSEETTPDGKITRQIKSITQK
jgi:hypothetical protein